MMPAVATLYPRKSLHVASEEPMHGPQGVYGVSIYDLCQ